MTSICLWGVFNPLPPFVNLALPRFWIRCANHVPHYGHPTIMISINLSIPITNCHITFTQNRHWSKSSLTTSWVSLHCRQCWRCTSGWFKGVSPQGLAFITIVADGQQSKVGHIRTPVGTLIKGCRCGNSPCVDQLVEGLGKGGTEKAKIIEDAG